MSLCKGEKTILNQHVVGTNIPFIKIVRHAYLTKIALVIAFLCVFPNFAWGNCTSLFQNSTGPLYEVILARGKKFQFFRRNKKSEILKQDIQNQIDSAIERLKHWGFEFKHPFQVIVETVPDTLAIKTANEKWSTEAVDPVPYIKRRPTRFAVRASRFLSFGRFKRFHEIELPQQISPHHPVIIIPARSRKKHDSSLEFIIAHEIAHLTQPYNRNYSKIWSEARSDLLAYLVTDETGVVLEKTDFDRARERNLALKTVFRSRSLKADVRTYHRNSLFIGSMIYAMSEKFGRQKLLSLISWMDRDDATLIRRPTVVKELPERLNPAKRYLIASKTPKSKIREVIASEIDDIVKEISLWAEGQSLEIYHWVQRYSHHQDH